MTEGVDGVFIGPGDLSASLGHLGDSAHPDAQVAIDAALNTIMHFGKPAGILTSDHALARKYVAAGCLFVAVGSDSTLLAKATAELAQRFLK